MFREPGLNPGGRPLHADHELARVDGGTHATRLMHASCNESRGAGRRQGGQFRGSEEAYLAERRRYWSREW